MQRPVIQNSLIFENNLFTSYLGDTVKQKEVEGTCNHTCERG